MATAAIPSAKAGSRRSFVCPTEIAEFGKRHADFEDRDAQVLGMSTDTHFVHLAWRRDHADLRSLPYPMLADTGRELSSALGILHKAEGVPMRATFIVDPEGVMRFATVNDLSVGRNVDEILRVLDALQTGELCRLRHMVGKPVYAEKPAGLRMNRLVQPATSKIDFELFSLAVSAINGCEACVRAHEKVVTEGGLTPDHVNDAVRIAATMSAAAVAREPSRPATVPRRDRIEQISRI